MSTNKDNEDNTNCRQAESKPSASRELDDGTLGELFANEAGRQLQPNLMSSEGQSQVLTDETIALMLTQCLRENETPETEQLVAANAPRALESAWLWPDSDTVARSGNSTENTWRSTTMISEEELHDLTGDASFSSMWMQYLENETVACQKLASASTPAEIIVYFKKWTSPGTRLWREAVKLFSLNKDEFPNWHDDICDKVICHMRRGGSKVRFLICRNKGTAAHSKSTQSGNWSVATNHEILVKTRQRFNDDRRKRGIKQQATNQNLKCDQPSIKRRAQANDLSSSTVDVAELLDNAVDQNPEMALTSASLAMLLSMQSDIEVIQHSAAARPPRETIPATLSVVGQLLRDHYGRLGAYTGMVLQSTGVPHGRGKMNYKNDGRTYDGEWHTGSWHGHGFVSFPTGDSYEGQHWFHQRHGRGTYRWKNGTVYDGGFKEGKRHGHGTCTRPNHGRYEGEFVDGQREGTGVYESSDGQTYYNGSWKNGHYDGYGTLISDSCTYSGEWRNGMAHERGSAVLTGQ